MASKYAAARTSIKPLTPDQLNVFLAEPRNAILATINKNGTPQCTPVSFYWDGQAFYISTFKETVKYKNIERDPRISITIDEDENFYPDLKTSRSVVAKGRAQLQKQGIWEMTGKIVERAFSPQEAQAALEILKQENRVLIVLKPERLQSWRMGSQE